MLGSSPEFNRLQARMLRVARAGRTTLIVGPTGSGKELVARGLHQQSARAKRPFVTVHCGALPESLVESELFGHSKGAFTGAVCTRHGLVRVAHGGTLFLDEVNALPLASQAKLLRFLETGEYRAVGSDVCHTADAWVIAATNQDLTECVRQQVFREDLLFRLDVMRLEVPALRVRGNDIRLLARHFLEGIAGTAVRFTEDAERALRRHSWPGNVRELKHRVESAALMAEGAFINAETLGLEPVAEESDRLGDPDGRLQAQLWAMIEEEGFTLGEAVGLCEQMLIRAALAAEADNKTRAARRLGIHVRTIFKKLARF